MVRFATSRFIAPILTTGALLTTLASPASAFTPAQGAALNRTVIQAANRPAHRTPNWSASQTLNRATAFAAADSALSAFGQQAFADISQCVSANGNLLAAIMVDDTGSLQYMDPENSRIDAVLEVIDALAELSESTTTTGEPLNVEANLSIFGMPRNVNGNYREDYRELVGWGSPTGTHGQALRNATERTLPNRGNIAQMGWTTDYRAALSGAQEAITSRAQQLDGQACSVIFWFTDGKLDVGPIINGSDHPLTNPDATEAARLQICQAGGIINELRQSHISVIAMALFNADATNANGDPAPISMQVSDQDKAFLQAVAEGSGPGGVYCGEQEPRGAFLLASDGPELARRFAGVGAMVQGANAGQNNLTNAVGPIVFPVDDAVGRVRLTSACPPGSPP